jgi:hypothetical protein
LRIKRTGKNNSEETKKKIKENHPDFSGILNPKIAPYKITKPDNRVTFSLYGLKKYCSSNNCSLSTISCSLYKKKIVKGWKVERIEDENIFSYNLEDINFSISEFLSKEGKDYLFNKTININSFKKELKHMSLHRKFSPITHESAKTLLVGMYGIVFEDAPLYLNENNPYLDIMRWRLNINK